jgi:hypothetical protein
LTAGSSRPGEELGKLRLVEPEPMKSLKDTLFNEKWHATTRSQSSRKDKIIHNKINRNDFSQPGRKGHKEWSSVSDLCDLCGLVVKFCPRFFVLS